MVLRLVLIASLGAASCGRSPVSAPSAPLAPEPSPELHGLPPVFDRAAVARATVLDPEYVHQLVYVNASGPGEHALERWAPGAELRYCAAGDVPREVLYEVAAFISRATGLSRSESGACNVDWLIDPSISGSGYTERRVVGGVIVGARLVFHNEESLRYSAGHEMGHAVGLGHSPRPTDLMYAHDSPGGLAFSADELAALALMYGR